MSSDSLQLLPDLLGLRLENSSVIGVNLIFYMFLCPEYFDVQKVEKYFDPSVMKCI